MEIDQFADIKILRYKVEGFESLPLERKLLLYHLSEAALWGRDIYWHQNGAVALTLRPILEAIYSHLEGSEPRFATYMKRVWFSSGLYHHYSNDKFAPDFSRDEFMTWASEAGVADSVTEPMLTLMFDPAASPKKVSLDTTGDLVLDSAVNFYADGITQEEATSFYSNGAGHPLNSRLTKDANGTLTEEVWHSGGMYGKAIEHIVDELGKAKQYACTALQAKAIEQLMEYYRSGNPTDFDEFNKTWVADKASDVDFINGFIEVYDDPLGLKGTWESIVELTDSAASKQIELIAANAQWFEDHSPVAPEFRKGEVKGVSMNVINAVMLGGECHPSTPIGVNLPNADWIREQYGSKSISLANITAAHHEAAASRAADADGKSKRGSVLTEFAATEEEIARCKRHSRQSDELHTQLHECLGHGSGQMLPGVTLDDLKAYGSTLEEARADLYALYFMADPKMVELGITESADVAWAEYDGYMRNGLLVQLARIEEGRNIEESHMRNRAIVARWTLERGEPRGIVSMTTDESDNHRVQISDYEGLRVLFGELLREVQRIKSEGDYASARDLVENYGVKIDPTLHAEVRRRYAALNIAPFSGFVNPMLTLATDSAGNPTDVTISYDESYDAQMLRYSQQYAVPDVAMHP